VEYAMEGVEIGIAKDLRDAKEAATTISGFTELKQPLWRKVKNKGGASDVEDGMKSKWKKGKKKPGKTAWVSKES